VLPAPAAQPKTPHVKENTTTYYATILLRLSKIASKRRWVDMISSMADTIRPSHQAGPHHEEFIFQRGKKPWQGVRSTTKTGQSLPFVCPECSCVVKYDDRGFAFCTGCAWAPSLMTAMERADLEARDPEMIPVLQFMQKAEAWTPSFEGHENKKKISGNERREKRFFSKILY
jgi:hypothetical protein